MTRAPAPTSTRTDAAPPRRVSHRHDATERQADRAADVVARGGSVTGWSFASVPAEASVHRDEDDRKKLEDKPRDQGEAAKEAAGKAIEAGVESELPSGKKVREVIEETPPLAAAAVGGLALAGKDVPVSGFPGVKGVVPPGVSIGLRAEGLPGLLSGEPRPGGGPTRFSDVGLGVTFGYTEQLPKGGKKPQSAAEKKSAAIAADTARLKNDPVIRSIEAARLRRQGLGSGGPVPFTPPAETGQLPPYLRNPGAKAPSGVQFTESALPPPFSQESVRRALQEHHRKEAEERRQAEEKKKSEEGVQREPASATDAGPRLDASGVDTAVRGGGRALDPSLRHSMEARFGYDFSAVRLHDDPQAASSAAGVDAAAFTVGEHIVFGSGRFDPSSPAGRHLLAHELAHIVQQRGSAAPRTTGAPAPVRRRGRWESFLIWAGLSEGTWQDAELRAYLATLTATREIEDAYDSDNKARAIVGRWKKNAVTWPLRPDQKALLIDEMIDGPTGDDDEDAILDLLEGSEADDLRWIFWRASVRYESLKSNLHGEQDDRLDAFVAARFLGGAAALRRGEVAVIGPAVAAGTRTFAMNFAYLEARIRDEDSAAAELLALIERSTPRDRARIHDYLWRNSWPATLRETAQVARSAAEARGDRKRPLEKRLDKLRKRIRTLNVLLGRFFLEKLPATAADLEASTRALTGKAAEEAREALAPKVDEPEPEPEERAPKKARTRAPDAPDDEKDEKDAPRGVGDANDEARRDAERRRKAALRRERKLGVTSAYRRKAEKALREVIDDQYRRYVLESGSLVAHSEIAPIADVAREETRAVLGRYFNVREKDLTGDTEAGGGNVHSWYKAHGAELKELERQGPEHLRRAAIQRIMKIYTADESIRGINAKYGAVPKFKDDEDGDVEGDNVEGRTLVAIARHVTAAGPSADGIDHPVTIVDQLNATYRNWGGIRRGSQVYVNLFEEGDPERDRLARWDKLRTLVHEYIHTLRHKDYTAFATSFGDDSTERHTLVEAVDDLFMGIVWANLAPRLARPDVRAKVEGARFAKLPPLTVPDPTHYESLTEAMALVRRVGVANVAAAYFLGLVDRIGGPTRADRRDAAPARRGPAGARSGARSGAKSGAKPGAKSGSTRGKARAGKGAK